mgnify:CR=1 FL=1
MYNFGYILVVDTLDEAISVANDIASEHLEIVTKNPFDVMTKIRDLCGKVSDYNKVVKDLNKALDEKCRARYDSLTDEDIKNKYLALFGEENIISISSNMNRVTVDVADINKVNFDGLRNLGVGVLISGNTIKCSSAKFASIFATKE